MHTLNSTLGPDLSAAIERAARALNRPTDALLREALADRFAAWLPSPSDDAPPMTTPLDDVAIRLALTQPPWLEAPPGVRAALIGMAADELDRAGHPEAARRLLQALPVESGDGDDEPAGAALDALQARVEDHAEHMATWRAALSAGDAARAALAFDDAEAHYRAALRAADGQPRTEMVTYERLAELHVLAGDLRAAASAADQALGAARGCGATGHADALRRLSALARLPPSPSSAVAQLVGGLVAVERGLPRVALARLEQSAQAAAGDDPLTEMRARGALALVRLGLGHFGAARRAADEAARLAVRHEPAIEPIWSLVSATSRLADRQRSAGQTTESRGPSRADPIDR